MSWGKEQQQRGTSEHLCLWIPARLRGRRVNNIVLTLGLLRVYFSCSIWLAFSSLSRLDAVSF